MDDDQHNDDQHNDDHKDALSNLERGLLTGRVAEFDEASLGHTLRFRGLIALGHDRDLEAVGLFRQSTRAFNADSLERAISERLYGLALIRIQREVEGTFALERADAILDREGYATFTLE
jgi:hypothetical protein